MQIAILIFTEKLTDNQLKCMSRTPERYYIYNMCVQGCRTNRTIWNELETESALTISFVQQNGWIHHADRSTDQLEQETIRWLRPEQVNRWSQFIKITHNYNVATSIKKGHQLQKWVSPFRQLNLRTGSQNLE